MTAAPIMHHHTRQKLRDPLEDAIESKHRFPQSKRLPKGTSSRQRPAQVLCPSDTDPNDTSTCGGDQSRRSYSAEQLRGHSMTIKVSRTLLRLRFVGARVLAATGKGAWHRRRTSSVGPSGRASRCRIFREPDYFDPPPARFYLSQRLHAGRASNWGLDSEKR